MVDSVNLSVATRQSKIQVAIITPGLAPYRIPLLNYLNGLPNVQLTALLCRELAPPENEPNDWSFDYRYFHSLTIWVPNPFEEQAGLWFSPGLWVHLASHPYDVVIALGWTMPNTLLAWLQCKMSHSHIVVWDESIPHSSSDFKKILMPAITPYIRSFDAYLGASSWCLEYFTYLGALQDRCVLFPQVADNDFFARGAALYRPQREQLKQELGITTRHVVLFVGQFIPRKGLEPLLAAFETLAQKNSEVSLVLVGEGVLKEKLLERRAASPVGARIFVHEFVSQANLPKYYALADIFVLPSLYDTFGVVIDEAMASGLPIVTTNRVGAVADLVRDGVNGRIIMPGDVPALADALAQLVENDALREGMGKRAAERMQQWSLQQAGEGFIRCIDLCLARPSSN